MSERTLVAKMDAEEFNSTVAECCAALGARRDCGVLLSPQEAHVGLASLCLHDLADLVNAAGKAIYLASREFQSVDADIDPAVVAHLFRYHFDYAAVALSAASNHLASAAWHFCERESVPLGRNYKTAAQVVAAWARYPEEPTALPLLNDLIAGEDWRIVSSYRDAWVHRGLPVLTGEYRRERREIWQDPADPAPSESSLKAVAEDGRVAYLVSRGTPEFDPAELLARGVAAVLLLIDATRRFLVLFDQVCVVHGVRFERGGMVMRR